MTYEALLEKCINVNILHLLYGAKICDSIQFIEATFKKLQLAKIEYQAISDIEKKLKTDYEAWRNKLFKEKHSFNYPGLKIEYFSIKLDYETIKQKLVYDFFHYLHGVFDTSLQFINKCLLANEQIKKIDNVNIKNIKAKLQKYPEYNNIYNFIETTWGEGKFQYIEDFNNINKHQYNLELFTNINLTDGTIDSQIPGFAKKEHDYDLVDLNDKIEQSFNYVIKYIDSLYEKVFQIIKSNQSNHNKFRYHSVTNYIVKSNSHNPEIEGANTFLVTDDIFQLGDIVRIMLVNFDNQKYEFRNIKSETIFIRNTKKQDIGILKAIEPSESNDKYELLEYRKYKVEKLGDIKKELILEFFNKPKNIQGNIKNDEIYFCD